MLGHPNCLAAKKPPLSYNYRVTISNWLDDNWLQQAEFLKTCSQAVNIGVYISLPDIGSRNVEVSKVNWLDLLISVGCKSC